MQQTSETWKQLLAAGAALETRAVIDGTTVLVPANAPVIHRGAMGEALAVGNVVSASLSLALRLPPGVTIVRAAQVEIRARFNDGVTQSEWLSQGTFYISRRARDPVTGVLALECYDALLKANAVWTPSAGTWPRSMGAVLTELTGLLGVTLDSRTVVPSGAAFVMNEPAAGTTIRDALGMIAQAGGGNWIMTPANLLRLVPVESVDIIPRDAMTVEGVVGSVETGTYGTVTGVRNTWEEAVTLTGDDTGIVIEMGLPPLTAAEAADRLIDRDYQAFRLQGAVYDPAAEIGDLFRAGPNGSTIVSAIYAEVATLGPAFRGDLAAPEPGELADEYPYIGGKAKAVALAKAYAREAVAALDDDLTQQEIFNRLTDNGAAQGMVLYNGQLYVNASYVNAGIINGDLVKAQKLVILDANGNEVASFDSVLVLGNADENHAEITPGSFRLYDGSDAVYMSAGDARDENGDLTRTYTGDGTTFKFMLMPYPQSNNITGISKVTVDGATVYGQLVYESGGAYVLIGGTAPASGSAVQVWFAYSQPIMHYTLGVRQDGALLGDYSTAEGTGNAATGDNSHAEGANNTAAGAASHAEGNGNTASGDNSHAEGDGNIARGPSCHAEGVDTEAGQTVSHTGAHAEGNGTQAYGNFSHAEGNDTLAYGDYSHVEGEGTVAGSDGQHVFGRYNIRDANDEYAEIVGNGSGANSRANARTLDWDGNETLAGGLSAGDDSQIAGDLTLTGALDVGDAATTRDNLGITPANIGAVDKTGDTMTGPLKIEDDIIQTDGYIKGSDNDGINHAIKLGHFNDNVMEFNEYSGLFNFYRNASNPRELVFQINGRAGASAAPLSASSGGTGATTAAVTITNDYSSILNVINAVKNTRIFPISIQKNQGSSYSDMPSGMETQEWNLLLIGDKNRLSAMLYIYNIASNPIYVRQFVSDHWLYDWVQIN